VPPAHFVHRESVVDVQVRALSQLVTPVQWTQESAAPEAAASWRNVPLAHSTHCESAVDEQVSELMQLEIGLQAKQTEASPLFPRKYPAWSHEVHCEFRAVVQTSGDTQWLTPVHGTQTSEGPLSSSQ
jgi:hypothetical protein